MSNSTDFVVLDLETTGLEYWDKDFAITSVSLARMKAGKAVTKFTDDKEEWDGWFEWLAESKTPLVVFNMGFEMGVLLALYPHLEFNWYCDVMRLLQTYATKPLQGYGLKAAVTMYLPEYAGYEQKAYDWIMANVEGAKKSRVGAHLSKLPRELLEEYNNMDVIVTGKLFELFTRDGFDWTKDHSLYMTLVEQTCKAKIHGIPVDLEKTRKVIDDIDRDVAAIDAHFNTLLADDILKAREILRQRKQGKFKKKIVTDLPEFNITSKTHLKTLFIDVQGLTPMYFTKKGGPSFKSAHIGSYSTAGQILAARGKQLIIKAQASKLLEKAQKDGRYHVDLRLVATVTGRAAGSGGLNIQGVSRKHEGLMECFTADDGYVFAELDFLAGEPTLIAHYTRDANYNYANFIGKGTKPFYKGDILMIDDVYLMFCSVSGIGSRELRAAFTGGTFQGMSFADMWLKDPEVIKKHMKHFRSINKMLALAIGYSAHPPKLRMQLKETYSIDLSEEGAQMMFDAYWTLFGGIREFQTKAQNAMKRQGYLINEFGFRCFPAKPHAAFNNYIQSSLSGAINLFTQRLLKHAPYMKFQTCIHDAIIVQVPEDKQKEFVLARDTAVGETNEILGWTLPVQIGCNMGKTWWDIK